MGGNGLVVTNRVGTPMGRQELITRAFKPLLRRASLPNIRFHDLRHTCATLLQSKEVHDKFVQELLAHATISTTIQNYKTLSPAVSRSAKGERHADTRVG